MVEVKREVEDYEYEERIKIEQSVESIRVDPEDEEVDKKEIDLDSIDMMQLPIQLDDGIDILNEVKYVFSLFILGENQYFPLTVTRIIFEKQI